ncbi:hypothetical protein ACRS8P_30325 [Burkholderia cenocepacia]
MTLHDLSSSEWWITAVVGSIAIKIIADYARIGLERTASKGMSAWTSRTKATKAKFDRQVALIRADQSLLAIYFHRESRALKHAVFFAVFALIGVTSCTLGLVSGLDHGPNSVAGSVVVSEKFDTIFLAATAGIVVTLSMFLSLTYLFRARYLEDVIDAAIKRPAPATVSKPSAPLK